MPDLFVDIRKIKNNLSFLESACDRSGIELVGVVKACYKSIEIIDAFCGTGIKTLGLSRLDGFTGTVRPVKLMMLRQPIIDEVPAAVTIMDIILVSTEKTIHLVAKEALRQSKVIDILLMAETGDNREGFLPGEIVSAALAVDRSPYLRLYGIGTNVACLEGVPPTVDNLSRLEEFTQSIEKALGRDVEVISGGNSSAWHLLNRGMMPPGINQLRFGEAILLGRETINGDAIKGCSQDAFILAIEILEVREKIVLAGDVKRKSRRAVLAAGYHDFISASHLEPVDEKVSIVRASSDHLVVEVDGSLDLKQGSKLHFIPRYPALVGLMNCELVVKKYLNTSAESRDSRVDSSQLTDDRLKRAGTGKQRPEFDSSPRGGRG